jgi:serine protease Do
MFVTPQPRSRPRVPLSVRAVAGLALVTLVLSLAACARETDVPAQTALTQIAAIGGDAKETTASGTLSGRGLPSIAELVERVRPSVVSITTEAVRRGLFGDFTDEGAGSGVIIRPDGLIATNSHVVNGFEGIQVHLDDGRTFDAEIVGLDLISDLAVLRIDATDLPYLTPAGSDSLRVGDWVVAVGNAAALRGGPTVTLGIISGRGRTITTELGQLFDLIQTDAAINAGNSGGPLIDLDGNVVGINTAMLRQAQGIGFAVSSEVATPILDALIKDGTYVRPLIGLTGEDVLPALGLAAEEGVLVTRMSRDGPAFIAGIRTGDIITALDDTPTPDMPAFLSTLWSFSPGDRIDVAYLSDGTSRTTTLTLVERP